MVNILDVAKYFLLKSEMEDSEPITHLKLQKLCYYSQAWYYTYEGEPLMDTEFQAWANGPVSRDLWEQYKDYGYSPLPQEKGDFLERIPYDEQRFLDEIWDVYGRYTAKYLSDLTHQEDPWKKARGFTRSGDRCEEVISLKSMRDYYKEDDDS